MLLTLTLAGCASRPAAVIPTYPLTPPLLGARDIYVGR